MEHQQAQDVQSKAKSFLQAKWFPGAIATLALVISIGGHGFTAFNSVGYAEMSNKIDNLQSRLSMTERADGNQDHLIQALQGEVVKQARAIQSLQGEIAAMRKTHAEQSADAKPTSSGFEAVRQEGLKNAELGKREKQPKANGVNARFDELIRSRMKPYYEQPPRRPGPEHMEDDDLVVLQFAVDRRGTILDVQVANTSGQMEFDNNALKAALRMNAIPEISRLNEEAYAQVKVFRLAVTPGQMK